jgi:putative endonuclease
MHYVYLLRSQSHKEQIYVGLTTNLRARFSQHNSGHSPHTRKVAPWHLVVYVAFVNEKAAVEFERYLKSGSGRAFAKRRFLGQ